jgi:flagellar basal-body rod protein FlgC
MQYLRVPLSAMAVWLILGSVTGCAAPVATNSQISVLSKADPTAQRLVAYLEAQHVRLSRISSDETRIEPGPACREALIRYLGVCQLRLKICSENIANVDTSRDSEGLPNPYRRKIVVVGDDGQAQVRSDDSPLKSRHSPGHPDANASGMVLYPNVDMAVETVDCAQAAKDFSMAVSILKRIDPTIVISESQVTDAFDESDNEGE